MPTTVTDQRSPANGRNARGQQQRPARPFIAGTRRTTQPMYDQTRTVSASAQDLPVAELDVNGFFTGLWLLVECTTAANAATVAFNADGPFNALDLVNLMDTNSQPIVGPMNGYDLYLIDKWGGYHFQDDPKASPIYTAVTGAGGTGGSFSFALWVPAELVRRDALGALPNKNAASTFSIALRLAPTATIYSTGPTTPGSVRVRIQLEGWQDPNISDIRGNPVAQDPPAVQTTQYWNKQTMVLSSGALNQRLAGIDSYVRNLIIVARDENGSRSQGESEFPDPFTLQYETAITWNCLKTVWRHMMSRYYGYTAANEAANGLDNGVYVLPFNFGWTHKPGYESRFEYLPVSSATNLVISGTIAGSGANQYSLLVNRVVPAGGNPLALTGNR